MAAKPKYKKVVPLQPVKSNIVEIISTGERLEQVSELSFKYLPVLINGFPSTKEGMFAKFQDEEQKQNFLKLCQKI